MLPPVKYPRLVECAAPMTACDDPSSTTGSASGCSSTASRRPRPGGSLERIHVADEADEPRNLVIEHAGTTPEQPWARRQGGRGHTWPDAAAL